MVSLLYLSLALGRPAECLYYRGDWQQVRGVAVRAEQLALQLGSATQRMWTSAARLWQGVVDAAHGQGVEVEAWAEEASWSFEFDGPILAQVALAERDLLAGRAEAARARLEPHLPFHRPAVSATLAWAHLERGEPDRATQNATEILQRLRASEERVWLVDVLRVRGLLALKRGRPQEAAATIDEALDLARTMPYPYAEAKALYVYGQLYAARGKPDLARERYQAALAICERLGEVLYRQHIEGALRELPTP